MLNRFFGPHFLFGNILVPDEVEADWQRPALCSLPTLGAPSGFTCLAFKMMWSYKEDLGMCDAVVYGGCDGTENLFDSEYKCQRTCDRPGIVATPKLKSLWERWLVFEKDLVEIIHFLSWVRLSDTRPTTNGSVDNKKRAQRIHITFHMCNENDSSVFHLFSAFLRARQQH